MKIVPRSPVFYGPVIVVASFLIQAVAWGTSNSFGLFFDPLLTEFGWLRATLSGAASLSFLVYGCVSILTGNLNDRFGPRLIMTGCGFCLGLGFLLMTTIHEVWQLYLFYGLVVGIGLSGMDVVLLSTIARWYKKKRGTMSGIIKVGTGVGMVVMPVLISWLLGKFGWRTSYAVLSAITAVSLISLAQFLVRDPSGKEQFPDNKKSEDNNMTGPGEEGLTFSEAIHTRQFWTVCTVYFIILVCVYTILMHIVQHAIDLGIPAPDAARILATIGAVSIAGRFVMGGVGDGLGDKPALLICLMFLLASMGWLQVAGALWMFYVFAAVYGFAHGGSFALSSPLVARLFGTRSHGLIFGIVIFSSAVGGAIGPVLAGLIFDGTGSYRVVFMILTLLSLTGLLLTMYLMPLHSDTPLTGC